MYLKSINHKSIKMKKHVYFISFFLVSIFVSAQTMVFNVQEVKVKDYLEDKLEEAYETCCKDMKPNKGGFALQRLGKELITE